jgi:hypothetical protein
MEIAVKEPWWELAERAAVEPDASKLLLLMMEINRLLQADRADKGSQDKSADET